jgi:soluble cytochrome b562
MKSPTLISTLLLALTFAGPLVRAQDSGAPAPAAAPAAAPDSEEKTDLDKKMDIIGKAMRKLKAMVKDPASNTDSLALVAQIHDAATAALDMTPAKEKDLPDADQAKFHADYQAGMKDFISQVDQLSAALTANDNDTAAKLFAQLGQTERKDHKQFRKPENK